MLETEIRTNPFPGLRSFEQDEEYLFFGREKQIDELLKKLRTTRFLSVIGASGSGKSSLVKSGLLPSLHSGYMTSAGSSWKVALFRPGNDPIGNLSKVLSENGLLYDHDGDDAMYSSIIEATLRRSRLGLYEAVRQSNITTGDNLLVIVDQFEELFRYSKYEEEQHGEKVGSQAFINLLLNSIKQEEANIYIALTMRSDFLGDCTQFRNLPEAINEGQYLIPRMTRDDIKQAIVGPIAVGGGEITPRLLTQLLNDVGDSPDQLPILQHALMRTWDFWEKNHNADEPIDLVHYEAIGTMSKALSLHAEEALSELPDERHKSLAEIMFKSLTDHGSKGQGIRRPTMMGEICELANASHEEIKTVIESFRKRGRSLLMPPVGVPLTDSTIIDISHESLMRVWTRLKNWDEEESDAAETYMRIANDAAMYQEGKMGLLRGPELELALKWQKENNPNQKWAQRYDPSYERAIIYLEHSKQQNDFEIEQQEMEQKKRLKRARRTIILFGIATIIFLILTLVAFKLWSDAETAKLEAKKNETAAIAAEKKAKENEKVAIAATEEARVERDNAKRSEEKAKEETIKAEEATKLAEVAKEDAIKSQKIAEVQRELAKKNENIAKEATIKANKLTEEAVIQRDKEAKLKEEQIAANNEILRQKNKNERLHNLEKSRSESLAAIQDINEGNLIQGAERAINAHKLNVDNDGPWQNRDNYNALNKAIHSLDPNRQILNSHKESVRAITINPVNDLVASGDEDGSIVVSRLNDGSFQSVGKFSAPGPVRSLKFSTRGDYLLAATFNKQLSVWDSNLLNSNGVEKIAFKTFPYLIKAIECLNFAGDDYVMVSTGENIAIEKITSNGFVTVDVLPIPNVNVIKVSKDQSVLLLGSNENLYEYSLGNTLVFEDSKITNLESHIMSLAISDDNDFIATGHLSGHINIIDRTQVTPRFKPFKEHQSRVSSINFHDVENRIQMISTGFDQTIKIIDITSLLSDEESAKEDKITINGHDKWIHGGMYSPNGNYYITIGEDNKVKTWHSSTAKLVDSVQKIIDSRK